MTARTVYTAKGSQMRRYISRAVTKLSNRLEKVNWLDLFMISAGADIMNRKPPKAASTASHR